MRSESIMIRHFIKAYKSHDALPRLVFILPAFIVVFLLLIIVEVIVLKSILPREVTISIRSVTNDLGDVELVHGVNIPMGGVVIRIADTQVPTENVNGTKGNSKIPNGDFEVPLNFYEEKDKYSGNNAKEGIYTPVEDVKAGGKPQKNAQGAGVLPEKPSDTQRMVSNFTKQMQEWMQMLRPSQRLGGLCTHKERLSNIRAFCKSKGNLGWGISDLVQYKNDMNHLLVDDTHEVLYCDLDLLSNMRQLKKKGEFNPILSKRHLEVLGLRKLEYYDEESARVILNRYQRVMVVKHPFQRLVSVWKEQFLRRGTYFRETLGVSIAHALRASPQKHRSREDLRFEEFIKYILETGVYGDMYWMTYDMCKPCSMRYDYISRTDSPYTDGQCNCQRQLSDSNIKFAKLTATRNVDATENLKTINAVLPDFHSVPREDINKLEELYKFDLSLLGYLFDSSTFEATCSFNSTCC